MGAYVYGVLKARHAVATTYGVTVRATKYLYKPSWGWDSERFNARVAFASGARAIEARWAGTTVLCTLGTPHSGAAVYACSGGTLLDDMAVPVAYLYEEPDGPRGVWFLSSTRIPEYDIAHNARRSA